MSKHPLKLPTASCRKSSILKAVITRSNRSLTPQQAAGNALAPGFNAVILFLALFLIPAVSSAVPEGVNLTWPGGGAGKVTFDGTKHAKKEYQCETCHISGLFQTKKNADIMTMDAMKQGKFCGVCHDGKKAFSTTDPKKCHDCHKADKKETSDEKKDVQPKDDKRKKKRN